MTVSVLISTTPPLTGATSHHELGWHAINWPKAYREVQRLQARIVQAEQAGKRGKVKALQRLSVAKPRSAAKASVRKA